MRSSTRTKSKAKPSGTGAKDEKASHKDKDDMEQEVSYQYSPMDEWMMKFNVNEKGIGQILLPPSLSILLQSDRISIAPFAGGLYIRSV